MASVSATSAASGVTINSPTQTITTNPYAESSDTILCDSPVSTYISASSSWTTWTAATCMAYNATDVSADTTSGTISSLSITPTGIASASLQHPTLEISTFTEFRSTAITTTITGTAGPPTQASNAPRHILNFDILGLTGLAWILYFSYNCIVHR